MNQKGSIFLYLTLAIAIISIIGGIYAFSLYLRFQTDEKLDEQRRQEVEQQVKKTFAPDLQLMDQ